jgi:hypothetical protein
MATRSDAAEFVRTLVTGDTDGNRRYERRLEEHGWVGFPQFLSAIFFLAVERRFKASTDRAEVVRFVADLRADASDTLPVDPVSIETLIGAVLDPTVEFNVSQENIGKIQMFVAHKALQEANLSESEFDAILAEADSIAERNR